MSVVSRIEDSYTIIAAVQIYHHILNSHLIALVAKGTDRRKGGSGGRDEQETELGQNLRVTLVVKQDMIHSWNRNY